MYLGCQAAAERQACLLSRRPLALSPEDSWTSLGKTPLDNIRIPAGYLRWRLTKAGGLAYPG